MVVCVSKGLSLLVIFGVLVLDELWFLLRPSFLFPKWRLFARATITKHLGFVAGTIQGEFRFFLFSKQQARSDIVNSRVPAMVKSR